MSSHKDIKRYSASPSFGGRDVEWLHWLWSDDRVREDKLYPIVLALQIHLEITCHCTHLNFHIDANATVVIVDQQAPT